MLVTGAGGAAAANFVASLRLAPEPFHIVGADTKPYHLELADVQQRYLVPAATHPEYLEAINRVIEREQIELVHPQPDIEVKTLSDHRESIQARLFLPSRETITLCQDKRALIARLISENIPAPLSFLVETKSDLTQAIGELMPRSGKVWLRAIRGAGARASLPVTTFEQGRAWIEYWAESRAVGWGKFMASEFLPGAEFAFQSLWHRGELITSQARHRLEYLYGYLTPSGQTSTPSVAVTVHRDDINDISTRAIRAVDPSPNGVFCVDLKENIDGVPCVTEINAGRFFTTSNFFAEAGSNMPYYYVTLAFGKALPQLPCYNAVPQGYYWVRMMDMGYKLVRGENWHANPV